MDGPRLENTARGLTVHANGRYLYSRRDPAGRPERVAASVEPEGRCLYFLPSPLLGYGLETLISRLPADSIILVTEASQELFNLCSPHISESIRNHPSLHWLKSPDPAGLHALLYMLGPWRFRRIRRVDLSGGANLYPETYSRLYTFISGDLATYWRNRHALSRMGREWIRHTYANISRIATGKRRIYPPSSLKIRGLPVVLGAGPSLEYSLEFLKKNRGQLWILVTDTAAMALDDEGIKPDAIAVLETQSWNMLDFHGLLNSGVPVIADITSYPPSLSCTGGDIYLFSSDFAELDFLTRLDQSGLRAFRIPPLGSVGLAAVELALGLSQGPALISGLDFAYSPGKSHARGTSVHRLQNTISRRTDPVPGWGSAMRRKRLKGHDASGSQIFTDVILQGYAELLRDRYAGFGRLMVLEPGGLDLGLPLISFSQAEKLLDEIDEYPAPAGSPGVSPPAEELLDPGAAKKFLTDEFSSLERVIRSWDSYAEGLDSAEGVKDTLEGMDQVFVDFPDEPPLPRVDDAFLVRAVNRSRKLRRYLLRQDIRFESHGGSEAPVQ